MKKPMTPTSTKPRIPETSHKAHCVVGLPADVCTVEVVREKGEATRWPSLLSSRFVSAVGTIIPV
jgi:hypothetical protein